MCIAIASPAGVTPPSLETLHTCWTNNSDGAGFAFPVGTGVKIMKGFMSWNDFKDAWTDFVSRYDATANSVLLHFRIATHGSRGKDMTHPFPIQYDDGALKKIEYVSDYAVIHNGIVSCVNQYRNQTGLSDTATFCKEYLTKFQKFGENWLHYDSLMELIYKMIDSKMAIMDKTGFIAMTTGFEESEGNFFSNTSYKENRYKYTNNYSPRYNYGAYSSAYDDDDDTCNYGSGIRHYNFNNEVATSDADIYDFVTFDSDYDDVTRGLMELKIGYTIACDGIEFHIDSKKDVDTIFVDRKRNVWEKICDTYTNTTTNTVSETVRGYSLIGSNGIVYDENGKRVVWSSSKKVSVSLFVEEK